MYGAENVIIVSNRSANLLRDGVITNYLKKLEESKRDDLTLLNISSKNFPSGEVYVQFPENLRARNIHVISGSYRPELYYLKRAIADSNLDLQTKGGLIENYTHSIEVDLRELEKIGDAARRSGCEGISVYLTFYPDARQDKKDEPRVPISAKLTIDNLVSSFQPSLKRFGTIDLHSQQIQGFTNYPVDHISVKPFFILYVKYILGSLDNVVLVSPDAGGAKDIQKLAKEYGTPYAISEKIRPEHSKAIVNVKGNVKDKIAVIIDDIICTGGTIIESAEALRNEGAKEVIVFATHGLFSTKLIKDDQSKEVKEIIFAEDSLRKANIKIGTTDTIARVPKYYEDNKDIFLPPITIAPLIADLIYCNESGSSHGEKLDKYIDMAKNENPKVLEEFLLK